jgi:hypothetical protein|tara:strand:+ start:258 stop:566 length:309 start_codon:yes stop_codon:yes gene_type:complete
MICGFAFAIRLCVSGSFPSLIPGPMRAAPDFVDTYAFGPEGRQKECGWDGKNETCAYYDGENDGPCGLSDHRSDPGFIPLSGQVKATFRAEFSQTRRRNRQI